jgi:DNA-binding transcriptional regulator YiaG
MTASRIRAVQEGDNMSTSTASQEAPPTPSSIKALRKRLMVSQTVFGLYVGVTLMTVSRWELGKVSPAPKRWKRLHELAEGGVANG